MSSKLPAHRCAASLPPPPHPACGRFAARQTPRPPAAACARRAKAPRRPIAASEAWLAIMPFVQTLQTAAAQALNGRDSFPTSLLQQNKPRKSRCAPAHLWQCRPPARSPPLPLHDRGPGKSRCAPAHPWLRGSAGRGAQSRAASQGRPIAQKPAGNCRSAANRTVKVHYSPIGILCK
jgi:hypothetical protein